MRKRRLLQQRDLTDLDTTRHICETLTTKSRARPNDAATVRRWIAFGLIVFSLNLGWEMAQSTLFANMKLLSVGAATLVCLRAALGDVVIFAIAFAVAALPSRNLAWPIAGRRSMATALFFITALLITLAYERYAVESGQWTYDARMPVIFGIGLAPIAQWSVLPAIALPIHRLLWRRRARI